ncbi:patatin-like phospholipase family protein [Actinomadura sp. WMMA1423]|uniref:patatin-like phospholipase family protein n=1 Tax=Actinomadura sp. WMMA1423 TaxID=2591108 RepID=UPI0011479A10|nr:patatin-like phospholipase family protein [Actinomadura sp. WMMA1423]
MIHEDLLQKELEYPGTDSLGSLWEPPSSDRAHVREKHPAGRAPFIAVLGSSGFRASWQAGLAHVLEEIGEPVRWDLASGGTIPGLAAAVGLNRYWRRIANAGAPTHKILKPAQGLRWFERKNLDLAGVFDIAAVEEWLAAWLAWAGVQTFRDLRYDDGQAPAGVSHRAGICVSMWRTDRPFPTRCTSSQLRDPEFIHHAFRWAFFSRQFPWRRFRQVWVPDTIGEHLPWLKNEIDDHSPAFWARVSMSQWPACLPTVFQDPATLQLIFLADGGHIDNQPSLFNDGRLPPLPLLNPRLAQNRRHSEPGRRHRDSRRMPFGGVVRFEVTPETNFRSLQARGLTLPARDAMWRRGVIQGRQKLASEFTELLRRHSQARERRAQLDSRLIIEIPGLHGFQAIAAAKRAGTRRAFDHRS